MASTTAAGTEFAISAGVPAAQTATAYAALTYTVVGGIEQIGSFGAASEVVTFTPLNGPVEKHKGPTNYGSLTPAMASNEGDAGQALMAVFAEPGNNDLASIRVTKPDGSLRYFQARVFGMPETVGAANSILMANPTVEVNTTVVRVAPTP